jgi:hypothetical protein
VVREEEQIFLAEFHSIPAATHLLKEIDARPGPSLENLNDPQPVKSYG